MTITYPLPASFWDAFPGWNTDFQLLWRQEQSRTAGGRTITKDLGSPLWSFSAQSISLPANVLDEWRARLDVLENGLKTFRAFPKSRCFPIAYPKGSWPTGGEFSGEATLATVASDRKAISLSGLPAGYTVSVGDFIQLGDSDLHRVVETAQAGPGGGTGQFEVRPHLWPSVAAGRSATVRQPSCLVSIVPGSVSSPAALATGDGTISFQAIEAR